MCAVKTCPFPLNYTLRFSGQVLVDALGSCRGCMRRASFISASGFSGKILVDALGSCLSCPHGEDDSRCAGDSVAACEDAFLGGLAVVFVCNDALAAVDVQTFCRGSDQRVGGCAQGHDDCVTLDIELGAGDLNGAASAGSIGLAQFHAQAGDALDPALLIRVDLNGVGQKVEYDAFFLGMEDFLTSCGELFLTSAVDDVGLGAQTKGSPCCVHGHVAAADDDSLFGLHDRGPGIVAESLHQVAPGEVFVGGEDTHGLLAGDVHELGKACAGTDKDGVKALFLHQGIYSGGLADDTVGLDLDTQCLDVLDLLLHDRILGEMGRRNSGIP